MEETIYKAVKHFLDYALNYDNVRHTWTSMHGNTCTEWVPEWLVSVPWTCSFDHMRNKWAKVTDNPNATTYDYLVRFWFDLDEENRRRLLEWILDKKF